jgi:hypothetical protein
MSSVSDESLTKGKQPDSGDDPRAALAAGMSAYMSREMVDRLLDECLSLEKRTWVSCPGCGKRNEVSIPDARATVDAVSSLLTQGYGRPSEQRTPPQIVVNRQVFLQPEDEEPELFEESTNTGQAA